MDQSLQKTAFASAHTRFGPHMIAYTAKLISIGLRPSGKSWRSLTAALARNKAPQKQRRSPARSKTIGLARAS